METAQWSRERIQQHDTQAVTGLHALVVGHTPVDAPLQLGNVHHIDTMGWWEGSFTLLELARL